MGFNAGNWLDFTAIVVSIVALSLALFSWRKSYAVERRMLEIEEARDRAAELQSGKANLTARLERKSKHSHVLIVCNGGPGEARSVSLQLDGKPASEYPCGQQVPDRINCLLPSGEARYIFVPNLSVRLPRSIQIAWEDDSGQPGRLDSHL